MNLVPKQIWKENYSYYSTKSIEDFKNDLKELLAKTGRFWDFSTNLTGGFISENEFELTPKWQLVYFRPHGSVSYLNGQIISDKIGTVIKFTVTPNWIFPFLILILPITTIIIFIATRKIQTDKNGIIGEATMLFILPAVTYLFCNLTKRAIKNRFINYFKLTELPKTSF